MDLFKNMNTDQNINDLKIAEEYKKKLRQDLNLFKELSNATKTELQQLADGMLLDLGLRTLIFSDSISEIERISFRNININLEDLDAKIFMALASRGGFLDSLISDETKRLQDEIDKREKSKEQPTEIPDTVDTFLNLINRNK